MLAFEQAISHLPDLELDIWFTRDSVPVVHHDESLFRMCGVDRPIHQMSFAELTELDAGSQYSLDKGKTFPFRGLGITVPRLEEVLKTFVDSSIIVELKHHSPEISGTLRKVLDDCKCYDRILLASGVDSIIKDVRKEFPEVGTNLSEAEGMEFAEWLQGGCKSSYQAPGDALQIPIRFGDQPLDVPEVIVAAHSADLEVHYWTINDADKMQHLLDIGADGIISDDPLTLYKVATARN